MTNFSYYNRAFLLLKLTYYYSYKAACYNSTETNIASEPSINYDDNVVILLHSLVSNSSTAENGYFNSSIGKQGPRDRVYGYFNCRGDNTPEACSKCLDDGIKYARYKCTGSTAAFVWHANCTLHFSNKEYIDKTTTPNEEHQLVVRRSSLPHHIFYQNLVSDTLHQIIYIAATVESGKKYATQEVPGSNINLFTLAQCTPDLTTYGCTMCLKDAAYILPLVNLLEGAVFAPKCNLMYAFYQFYDSETQDASSPGPEPSLSLSIAVRTGAAGWKGIAAKVIVAVAVTRVILDEALPD